MSFFFELYTEEIPAGYQPLVLRHWRKELPRLLQENLLLYQGFQVYATPRRLTCSFEKLSETQVQKEEELKGPPKSICCDKDGNPTPALLGFAKKANVNAEEVKFKIFGKTEYAFALQKNGGKATSQILPQLLEQVITSTRFPRQMHWGNFSFSYARPILGYYGYFFSKPLQLKGGLWDSIHFLGGVQGHQVLQPSFEKLQSFEAYQSFLSDCGIILEEYKREQTIRELLTNTAQKLGLQAVISESLLEEVNFLVEKPGVLWGEFPSSFLTLPEKVILSEMEEHQRYFAMREPSGNLSHRFLVVTNADNMDEQTAINIKAGNERVLKARLSDGKFFFDEDRKKPLRENIENLRKIVFQEGMGNMFDKKERLKKIADIILQYSDIDTHENKIYLNQAAELCKADLSTQLVYEFDSLQGEIGSVYAALDNEAPAVVAAIREHYLPKFQGDVFPQTTIGVLLSLADKFDNIISGFLLGKAPTSSQDPLALRRQCLYVIELTMNKRLSFVLEEFLPRVQSFYPANLVSNFEEQSKAIVKFFKGRVITIFDKEGFDKKMIRAALFNAQTNLLQLNYRLLALRELQKNEDFTFMMGAFKRMNNIIGHQSEHRRQSDVSEALLQEQAEKELYVFGDELQKKLLPLQTKQASKQDYLDFFLYIAEAKNKIDSFFESVMVNHEERSIRENRLALLSWIVSTVEKVLALSELE